MLLFTIALMVLALLPLLTVQGASTSEGPAGSSGSTLYLGKDGSLTNAPNSQGSADIKGSTGTLLLYTVGTWKSAPAECDVEIYGPVSISLWASASGVIQLNCYFNIYLGVNDQRGDTAMGTDHHRLGSTPVEFTANDPPLICKVPF